MVRSGGCSRRRAFLVLNLVLACVGAVWWAKSTYNKRRAAAAARRELLRAAAAPSAGDRERADAAIARHATALAGEERSGACAICLGDLDDAEAPLAAARVACGHAFHVDCLRPWLAHCARGALSLTCPTCRTPVCPVVAPDVEAGDVVPVNSGLDESHRPFFYLFVCDGCFAGGSAAASPRGGRGSLIVRRTELAAVRH